MVVIVRVSKSRVCERFDNTMAKWGRQSPHFSSPQHYRKIRNTAQLKQQQRHGTQYALNVASERGWLQKKDQKWRTEGKLTVADAGILPDINW